MRDIALGILLFLFLGCFAAIITEELFLGGRRKRRLLREARARASSSAGAGTAHNDTGRNNAHHTDH